VPFAVGSRVAHAQWGGGVVQRYEEDALVVLFDEVGYKTLALDVVRERGLLSGG
jgi:ATP-dependent DNA helicase RecQ